MHKREPKPRKLVSRLLAALSTVCATAGALQIALPLPAQADPICIIDNTMAKQLDLPILAWTDRTKTRKANIVAVPGLTLYAASWDAFAKHLASRGYRVYSLDMRGFGRWRTEGSKWNGNNKIEIAQSQQDLLDLVTTLRQRHPKEKLYILGESLGSNMGLALIEDHPELADGAILGSLCHNTRIHPHPIHWAADAVKEVVRPNKPLNLEPYAAPYLTNDPVLAKQCDNDPMIFRKMTPAELVKVDVLDDKAVSGAKKLPANFPICLIAGYQDAMFKQELLPKVILKWGTQNVSLNYVKGGGHLLMEHQPVNPKVAAIVDGWLLHPSNTGVASTSK